MENLLLFKGAVIGTLMGDSSVYIKPRCKTAILKSYSTSLKYLEWKQSYLSQLNKVLIRKLNPPNGWNKKQLYELYTRSHPIYTKLRMRMYHEGRKTIDDYCLKTLNALGLFWWYLDDGSLDPRCSVIKFTSNFNLAEYRLIQKYFNDRFKLRINIKQSFRKSRGKRYLEAYLKACDRLKFLDLISPYIKFVPDDLQYKIPIKETLVRYAKSPFHSKAYKKDIV